MSGRDVIVLGATGMVGGEALRLCLADPRVARVTVLGRKSVGISDPKLVEVIHQDFSDYAGLEDVLEGQDAALFCLGAYTGSVSDELFKKITVDFAVAFARALYASSPEATFCLLSGAGADRTEKSRVAFAKYKGMAENALFEVGFPRAHTMRPAYIYPVERRDEPNMVYRVARRLYPLVSKLAPSQAITSRQLASAMVYAALNPDQGVGQELENLDLLELARRAEG